ncbi:MAG: hypothetical protein J6A28_01835 [Clostridia bacterium]|nr:hypothetical protein [Clostridia bacterium]
MYKDKLTIKDKKEFLVRCNFKSVKPIDVEKNGDLRLQLAECCGIIASFDNYECTITSYPLNSIENSIVKEYGIWMIEKMREKEGEKVAQEYKRAFNKNWAERKKLSALGIKIEAEKKLMDLDCQYKEDVFIEDDEEKAAE